MTSLFRVERQRVSFESDIKKAFQKPGEPAAQQTKDEVYAEIERQGCQAEELRKRAEKMLASAQQEKEQLLAEAQGEKEQLLAEARQQVQTLRADAKERGYEEGLAAARDEREAWLDRQREEIGRQLQELSDHYDGQLEQIEESVISIVMEITKKVINVEMEKDDVAFTNVVSDALAHYHQDERIVVHLCGRDYQRYAESGAIGALSESKGKQIFYAKEPFYREGDCILETDTGFTDCGISGQLERLDETFRQIGDEMKEEADGCDDGDPETVFPEAEGM